MWKDRRCTDFKLPISDIHLKKWEVGHILYELESNLDILKRNIDKLKKGEEIDLDFGSEQGLTHGIKQVIYYLADPEYRYELLFEQKGKEEYRKRMEKFYNEMYDGEFIDGTPLNEFFDEEGVDVPLDSDNQEQFYEIENLVKLCED